MIIAPKQKPSNKQTFYVAIALVIGIIVGELLNLTLANSEFSTPNKTLSNTIDIFSALTDIFLRLIKMIIAPLVFSTLVVGMAKMGDIKTVGRIGIKALLWFFSASLFSLLLGMILVNVFEPGSSLHIALQSLSFLLLIHRVLMLQLNKCHRGSVLHLFDIHHIV